MTLSRRAPRVQLRLLTRPRSVTAMRCAARDFALQHAARDPDAVGLAVGEAVFQSVCSGRRELGTEVELHLQASADEVVATIYTPRPAARRNGWPPRPSMLAAFREALEVKRLPHGSTALKLRFRRMGVRTC